MTYLVRAYGDTDFVTGLRAIAAIMVVSIHTAAFRDFGWLGNTVTDNGKYGVHVFFVISGFTIARTYRNAETFGEYFGRRVMRIAPLYFFMILTGFFLIRSEVIPTPYWMEFYGTEADSYNLLMHLTFLSAWDARVAASILGVEWTIPIEMFWYAVLPLVLLVTSDTRKRWGLFLGLLVLAGLAKGVELLGLPKHSAHFLPFSYGAYFYLGALAESWRLRARDLPKHTTRLLTWAATALFVLGMVTDTGLSSAFLALATVGLIAFRGDARRRRGILCLWPLLFLGSISYSLYLIHPLAIELVAILPILTQNAGPGHFLVVLTITIALSVVTYSVIEYPSNRLGLRLFGLARVAYPSAQRMRPNTHKEAFVMPAILSLGTLRGLHAWKKRGWSDNAPQFVKEAILRKYAIGGATWIETGTYMGTTTRFLSAMAPQVYTIEPGEKLFRRAARRFANTNVEVIQGVSEDVFPDLLPTLSGDVCFWLDGHYSAGKTFRGDKDCPVEDELAAIDHSLSRFGCLSILIDDVRCFLPSAGNHGAYPSIDYLVDWARTRGFEWRIEQDIFIIRNWS